MVVTNEYTASSSGASGPGEACGEHRLGQSMFGGVHLVEWDRDKRLGSIRQGEEHGAPLAGPVDRSNVYRRRGRAWVRCDRREPWPAARGSFRSYYCDLPASSIDPGDIELAEEVRGRSGPVARDEAGGDIILLEVHRGGQRRPELGVDLVEL